MRHRIGPKADDDHTVPSLGNSERIRTNYEVRWLTGLAQSATPVLHGDCAQLVQKTTARSERGKIFHQHLEDLTAFDRRGEHALYVLHHERGGPKPVQDSDVLTKQIVPLIFLGNVASLASCSRSAYQGVGLTRRSSNQDRVVKLAAKLLYRMVDLSCCLLAPEFEAPSLFCRDPPGIRIDLRPGGFDSISRVKVDEFGWQDTSAPSAFPEKCPEREGTMRRCIVFDRNGDAVGRVTFFGERSKSLAEASRAREEIDDSKR